MPRAAGLAYRDTGSPDGSVALLLHGFPESSYMWRELMPTLVISSTGFFPDDEFAPLAGALVREEAPARCTEAVTRFLARLS